MTTTELYSGYTAEGKPSSRVLRPPGGQSSNIFGDSEPTPQEQVRREQRQAPPPPQQQGGAGNATNDAQQEYQRNKPQGKGEAPFATFAESGKNSAPSQFDSCDPGSQNDADFRCYSVSDYRNAVVQNAAIRQRAHGQATSAFNPITHEEAAGGSPYKEYNQSRPHPQQVTQQQQQQQQQQPVRMVRGQNNQASGKDRSSSTGDVNYNPITGEEYPADYGKQNEEEVEEQKTEEESQEENNESTEENAEKSSPAASKPEPEQSTPTPTPAPAAPFQKVRHPPGGKSSGPLW